MNVAAEIRARLAALEPVALELEDESERHRGHAGYREGGQTHWKLSIVSPRFAGLSRLEQHRLVYAAVQSRLDDGSIHALALRTRAPEAT